MSVVSTKTRVLDEATILRAAFAPLQVMAGFVLLVLGLLTSLRTDAVDVLPSLALALGLSMAGALLSTWDRTRGPTSTVTAYILVFGLFHAGLVVAVAVGGEELLVGQGDNSWLFTQRLPDAVRAVVVGMIALTGGVLLVRALTGRQGRPRADANEVRPEGTVLVGAVATGVGFLVLSYVVAQNGGLALLTSGYGGFLEAVGGAGTFGYGTIIFGFGVGFLVAGGGAARRTGWIVFVVFALIGLPLGLRGTVLFLGVALLAVEAKKRRVPVWLAIGVSYACLMLIDLIRVSRAEGIGGLFRVDLSRIVPLRAIAEMGYSLKPAVVVDEWMSSGTQPLHGVTLIAPLVRFVERFLGVRGPSDGIDDRLFNVEILYRAGPIGGSPVAEGLRNGGLWFVIGLMLVIGIGLALMDRLPATPLAGAATMVVFLPLLIAVRNSLAPVLIQMALGVILLLVASYLSRSKKVTRS